jgi:RHS repeat-associated protein
VCARFATFSNGSQRRLVFNAAGYVIKDISNYGGTMPGPEETDYTRDPNTNFITDVQDALTPQRDTHYEYDSDGNVTQVTYLYGTSNAVSNSYQYDYTQFDQLNQFTNGLGKVWTIINAPFGDPLTKWVEDPLQRVWSASYNSNGLLTSLTDPANFLGAPLLNFSYYPTTLDLQKVTDRASETTTFQYDTMGRQTQVTSPLQETQQTFYDDKDEVISTIDPDLNTTSYGYNLNGNLNELTDANKKMTTWSWSPPVTQNTWNVKECDPNHQCASYLMENSGGAIDQYIDKNNIESVFTYDTLGRMIEAQFDKLHVLSMNPRTIKYTYDKADRVTDVRDSAGASPCTGTQTGDAESFTYDGLDDVLTACTPEGTVVYTPDAIGRRQTMAPAGQPTVNYSWDDADELKTVCTSPTCMSGTSATLAYNANGQRQSLTVNNVTSSYAYDPTTERLSSISYASTQNPSLGSLNYSYDADGRITGKSGSFGTVNLPAAEGPNTYSPPFTNQLETWKGNSGTQPPDSANNLKSDPSTPGVTYAYDARNLLNQITTIRGTDTYTYDAAGRRESVTSGGNTTSYLYDGATPVSAGTVSMVSLPESNEILSMNGLVPVHDALGATLAIVNSSGAIATQYTYDPFGNVTPGSFGYGTTFGMGGIEFDPTGLYDADARFYHPTLQRFLSEDPAGYGGGDINLFAYSGSDPVNASDPSGLDACPGGDCGGGDPGGIPNIFYLFFFFPGGSSSGPAQWTTFTKFWEKLQLAQTLPSVGVTVSGGPEVFGQGGVFLAADTDMTPIPPLNSVPTVSPGPEWLWAGLGPKGSNSGSWLNPSTKWALHPDYGTHDLPKGDHYDLQKRGHPKHSLRMEGPRVQLWSDGSQRWLTLFNFEWLTLLFDL